MNSVVQFPDPRKADDEGLIAMGGELSADFLISAYSQGVFPWFNENDPILWWSPNPRMVLVPDEFRLTKSLKQIVVGEKFEIRIDTCFRDVIEHCRIKDRPGQGGTWITIEMRNAYVELHRMGLAHSFEAFYKGELAGGLYGVSLGKAFFGESMFFLEPNSSKFAFYHLVSWCRHFGYHFIDAQQPTGHLRSLGAKEMPRNDFLDKLSEAIKCPTMKGKWKVEEMKL